MALIMIQPCINLIGGQDEWQIDLAVPKHNWEEYEEWRKGMALPDGNVWFSSSSAVHVQYVALTERQAMLFKLRWA